MRNSILRLGSDWIASIVMVTGVAAGVSAIGCGDKPAPAPVAAANSADKSPDKTSDDSTQNSTESIASASAESSSTSAKKNDAATGGSDSSDSNSGDAKTGDSKKGAAVEEGNSPPSAAEKPGVSETAAKPAAAESSSSETKANPATPEKGASGNEGADPNASMALGVFRLLLLRPGGPTIVDLHITVDNRPLGESLDEAVTRILAEADADKDGRATWDEMTRQPAFARGVYGNMPINADNDRRQVVQRYDWNRDKVVSRDELLRWLVREAHRARPLVIDSLVRSREASLVDSELLRVLDTNRNGQLDADEITAAAGRLASRDADEDDVVERDEIQVSAQMPNDPNSSSADGGPALVWLSPKIEWDQFQRTMQNQYSLGGPLGPDVWPNAQELFRQLDVNGDRLVGRSEWAGLRKLDADLQLEVKLGGDGDKLELGKASGRLAEHLQAGVGAGALRFELPEGRVEVVLSPSAVVNFEAQAMGVLSMYDADKNNYLEESEAEQALMAAGGTFAEIDTDSDGKIYVAELVAALRKRQSVTNEQARVQAGYREDGWWQVVDTTGDNRLDAREIEQVAERLKSLDANGDGVVSRDEIPVTFVVGISRGGGDRGPGFLPPVTRVESPVGDLPAWFVNMDSNGDRLIGRREFLGGADLFEKLDANRDGRIEWSEVKASSP